MSSFRRSAIFGSLLEFSTGPILPKKMDLTPNPVSNVSVECISPIPHLRDMRPFLVQEDTISMASEG